MATLTQEDIDKGIYIDADGLKRTSSGYLISRNKDGSYNDISGASNQGRGTRNDSAVLAQRQQEVDDGTFVKKSASTGIFPKQDAAYRYQGNYQAYTTHPYAQDAITAQQNAIQAALAQYDAQQKQAQAVRESAMTQALNNYRAQQEQARQAAEAASRQAYISRMLQERDLGQQLSASGYSGGLTDSAYLRLLSNYENSRNSILNQRDQQIADLALAIANERAQAQADIANNNAEIAIARARAEMEGNEALAKLYASIQESAAVGRTGGDSPRKTKDNSDDGDEIAATAPAVLSGLEAISPGVASFLSGNRFVLPAYTPSSGRQTVPSGASTPSELLNQMLAQRSISPTNNPARLTYDQAVQNVNANVGRGNLKQKLDYIASQEKRGFFDSNMADRLRFNATGMGGGGRLSLNEAAFYIQSQPMLSYDDKLDVIEILVNNDVISEAVGRSLGSMAKNGQLEFTRLPRG